MISAQNTVLSAPTVLDFGSSEVMPPPSRTSSAWEHHSYGLTWLHLVVRRKVSLTSAAFLLISSEPLILMCLVRTPTLAQVFVLSSGGPASKSSKVPIVHVGQTTFVWRATFAFTAFLQLSCSTEFTSVGPHL